MRIRVNFLDLLRHVLKIAETVAEIGGIVVTVLGQRAGDVQGETSSAGSSGPVSSSSFSSTSASSTRPAGDRAAAEAAEAAARAAGQ